MRLINIEPLIENGWILERHGVANCHLATMSLADVPTIDPESLRPKGRWVHNINNLYGCNQCLGRETMSPKKLKPYCPNCGAKMEG